MLYSSALVTQGQVLDKQGLFCSPQHDLNCLILNLLFDFACFFSQKPQWSPGMVWQFLLPRLVSTKPSSQLNVFYRCWRQILAPLHHPFLLFAGHKFSKIQ